MLKLNQKGLMNPLVIPLIFAVIATIAFGVMAFIYYGDYVEQRDDNAPIIASAVEEATTAQKQELEAEFVEREKEPNDTYTSPSEFGSIKLTYPKTWSAYVERSSTFDFYAHPAYVPSNNVNYALRASVENQEFSNVIRSYDSKVRQGDLKAGAVTISGVKGVRLDGFLENDQEGSMVIFPLRDKTLSVWTENKDFRGDFNNIVLKKLSFRP